MTKKEAVERIESLDKKERYLNEKKQEIQRSNLAEQINKFWKKSVEKTNVSAVSCDLKQG